MPILTSGAYMKLFFDNGAKEYKLYSFNNSAPSLCVRPTVKLGSATAENAPMDHPLFGHGSKGSLQVIPSVVDFFTSRVDSNTKAPSQVAVKWARGKANIRILAHELQLYDNDLRPLQGTVVPYCYGLYVGHIEGLEIGCLALEWCAGRKPPGPFEIK